MLAFLEVSSFAHKSLKYQHLTNDLFFSLSEKQIMPPLKKSYEPLDLSRRCDSVDTMKTPSPYSVRGSSPTLESSPPTNHHSRSIAYSDHSSHNSPYPQSIPEYSSYTCQKRESPSPEFTYYGKQHSQQSSNLSPYVIQAALQQRLLQHTPPAEDDSSETSTLNKHMLNSYPYQMVVGRDGKLSRPFKAYPRDPLCLSSFPVFNPQSAEKFEIFRTDMLKRIHAANGGQPTISNPKMRRTSSRAESNNADSETIINNNNSDSSNSGVKDSAYYERRKKNNAAAKKSRDRRRIKEDEIAIRATFLENENRECQAELLSTRNQLAELKIELAAVRKQLAMYGV